MPCVSQQRNFSKFQEEPSDLETQLLELGFLCENENEVGQTTASFAYNAHGSMTSMPHLSAMDWDFAEKLCHITRGTTEAYYNYDGNGIRTRKVVEKNGVVEIRLYLGGFEIWRKTVNGVLDTERETLHVMDDKRRIALVETLTVENGNAVANPLPVLRYQLDNHLGSASLELDASANVISYEEYYPYGDTSYCAGRNASEVSRKRYRYTGKEKDEESSLYYCEQRYYAAHISRWVSTDPTWLEDGINLYAYVHGNPVSGVDPSGTQTVENDEVKPIINGENFLCGFSKINQDGEKEEFSELKVLENESKKTDYKTTTDAGHGDRLYKHKTFDPGALSGTDKGNEKDFALKVEAQVDFWLQEFGIQNQRTRTGDVELGENEKKLHWRVDKAKEFGSSVLVSIHLDSGNKPGLFSIYKTEEGKKLGEYIAQNIKTLPLKGDGLRKDIRNLFLLRKFDKGAAVIIELGGIKNEKTQTDINISSFYIGKEIATGIYQYLYNGKTPSPQKIGFCKW